MLYRMRFVFSLLCILLVCTPNKKISSIAPDSQSSGGIVYKPVSDSINEEVKNILLNSLKNISVDFFSLKLQKCPFMCGPILWSQIKPMIPEDDSVGIPITLMIPDMNPDGTQRILKMEARAIREKSDISRFFSFLNSLLENTDSLVIRKLTETEKKIYWGFISWDIEEPVFIVEVNKKLLVIDLTKSKDQWGLFYIDEISSVLNKWEDIQSVRDGQSRTHDLAKSEQITEAEEEAIRTLKETEKLYGKKDKNYGIALCNLGNIYAQMSNVSKAESLYIQAADVVIGVYGMSNPYLANIYNNLANLYDCQGRYTEAEMALRKALKIFENRSGEEAENMAIIYASLASNYKSRNDFEQSLKTHQIAIPLFEKFFGKDNPNLAIEYSNLGECYFEMKQYEAADTAYRKAETILLKALGADNGLTIGIRANVGRNLVYSKKYTEAEPLLTNAIDHRLKNENTRIDRTLLEPVESLGKLYRETGDSIKALGFENWAKEIKEKTSPESSCDVLPEQ